MVSINSFYNYTVMHVKHWYLYFVYEATFTVVLCPAIEYKYIIVFGPRRDKVTGEWRRLHNEELNDLYSSPNIVRVIKSRRMRWAGHVARMGEERGGV